MTGPDPRVTAALTAAGIAYRVHRHDSLGVPVERPQDVATALGMDPGAIAKTLLLMTRDGRPVVAVVPVTHRVPMAALADVCQAGRLALAPRAQLMELLGQEAGGVSPLGLPDGLAVFLHPALLAAPSVLVGGGVPGVEIQLDPAALAAVTAASVIPLPEGASP